MCAVEEPTSCAYRCFRSPVAYFAADTAAWTRHSSRDSSASVYRTCCSTSRGARGPRSPPCERLWRALCFALRDPSKKRETLTRGQHRGPLCGTSAKYCLCRLCMPLASNARAWGGVSIVQVRLALRRAPRQPARRLRRGRGERAKQRNISHRHTAQDT